jgi:hypothetical protein
MERGHGDQKGGEWRFACDKPGSVFWSEFFSVSHLNCSQKQMSIMNNDNNEECMDEEAVLLDSDEDLSDCDDGNILSDVIRYSMHNEAKQIIQLEPTNDVTVDNVTTTEDSALLSQLIGLHARMPSTNPTVRHSNCTVDYWLRSGGNRKQMIAKCVEH